MRKNGTDVAHYLDTSALVKLVVQETETPAMRAWLTSGIEPVSCDLTRTELMRAVRRVNPDTAQLARAVLDGLTLTTVTTATFEAAARLLPDALRTLDAVHLAAALALGDDLDAMVTYDDRLAGAASLHGVSVLAPGKTVPQA